MPVSDVEGGYLLSEDLLSQVQLQEIVLRYRWCGFRNTKRWLEEIMQAVMKDLLGTLDLPLSQHDQTRLASFIASLPASSSVFKAMALDNGSSINLQYPRPLATALYATYHGPDIRFDQDSSPNLTIAPITFLVLPPHVLMGKPKWSQEKIDELKMLSSHVNLRTVQYQLEAFHQGMTNAVVERHYDALLMLVWLATRLAESSNTTTDDDNPFEPPAELFRLVARRDLQAFIATGYGLSGGGVGRGELEISIRLFTLLLRAHAESMPQNDPEIEAWANHLRTCQYTTGTEVAFATWVSDWSSKERCSEFIHGRYAVGRRQEGKVRRPIFQGGSISREEEMARRFNEILGGRVMRFGKEVERRE